MHIYNQQNSDPLHLLLNSRDDAQREYGEDGRDDPRRRDDHLDGRQTHLRLDDEGEFIDRWPNGFFREHGELLF